MRFLPVVASALVAFAVSSASADMVMLGDLHIEQPMLRATPPNAPVAGGFVTIMNMGEADDVLTAAAVDTGIAAEVQLHQMEMNNGVMKMSEVEGGIALPAGETVTLAPGGLHLMIMGLEQSLTAGDTHTVTLTFANAGDVTLDFPVLSLAEIRALSDDESDHGGSHGDHGKHGN